MIGKRSCVENVHSVDLGHTRNMAHWDEALEVWARDKWNDRRAIPCDSRQAMVNVDICAKAVSFSSIQTPDRKLISLSSLRRGVRAIKDSRSD